MRGMHRVALLVVLFGLASAACPEERDLGQRCYDSSECPDVECPGGETLQYCRENLCETDPDAACAMLTTSASSGAGGA